MFPLAPSFALAHLAARVAADPLFLAHVRAVPARRETDCCTVGCWMDALMRHLAKSIDGEER